MRPMELKFNRRILIENIAALFSGSAVAQGMTALALLLTARQLGAADYGQYAASLALTSFSAILFSLGMDIWLLREGGRRLERLGELLGSVLAIKVGLGLVWFALLAILAPFLNPLTHSNTFPAELIRLSALAVWLDSTFASVLTSYKASLRNKYTSALDAGSDTLWLLATVLLVFLGTRNAAAYFLVRIAVLAGSLAVALFLAGRAVWIRPQMHTIRQILGEAFPYAASEFLAWTSMRLDVLIVAMLLGEVAVGLYSPAVGLANALFIIPAAVYAVILPVLSNLFANHVEQAWLTAKRSLWLLMALGAALSIALYFLAGLLVSLLGTSFGGSQEILQILSVILFIHSISFGMAAILVAVNEQAKRTVVQAIAVAVNGVFNLVAVSVFGIRGVAYVYVLTELVLLGGYSWLVLRYHTRTRATASQAPQG
jgi:O-antigen/teichoic acid export membrane protein